jgi:hypothetical protein
MSGEARSSCRLVAVLLFGWTAACADFECPEGTFKVGGLCLKTEAGVEVSADEAGVFAAQRDAGSGPDAFAGAVTDTGLATPEGGLDGGTQPTVQAPMGSDTSDAGNASAPSGADGGASTAPMGECDQSRTCSPGYACMNARCVSACEQTRCDPNATCAINAGAPVCTCNNGYITQGSGTGATCAADVSCAQLACDRNAGCEVGTNQVRACKCKLGYTGTGTTCTPVSCTPLTIENGTVTGGNSYNETSTYRCNAGYNLTLLGDYTRRCGADMQWTGTAPRCNAVECGPPPTVENATVSPSTAGTYNSTATYTCNTNSTLSGSRTITCQASGFWTARPMCMVNAMCGNGRVEGTEQCESTAPGTDPWSCNPSTCRRSTAYNSCLTTSNGAPHSSCSTGELCWFGMCAPSCTSTAACPNPPSGLAKACVTGAAICAAGGCRSSGDCAPGLGCVDGSCMGCNAPEQCQSQICTDIEGNSAPNFPIGRYGRCRL